MRLLPALLILAATQYTSCSTPQVNFQSGLDVVLTAKKIGDFNDKGEVLKANTPLNVDDLKDKMVEISFKDKPPYYWVMYQPSSGDITVKVDSPNFLKVAEKNTFRNPNILPRLVFMSLRALDRRDFKSANELADQIITTNPEIAIPWVIKGLVKLDEGKKPDAIASFQRAKALDPSDAEIDKILKEIK